MEDNIPVGTETYNGPLFDVVVTSQQQADPETIKRLINPDFQQQAYQASLRKIKQRYGNLLEQLKHL